MSGSGGGPGSDHSGGGGESADAQQGALDGADLLSEAHGLVFVVVGTELASGLVWLVVVVVEVVVVEVVVDVDGVLDVLELSEVGLGVGEGGEEGGVR